MVYPDDHPSTQGSRDIIDGPSDVSLPYILLVRHGSSDHLQPNFPTPGQIRSMFNTSKISECPEYASSPSTMSDPLEWRPSNQVELLEERLMRIRQWNDNVSSYVNRNYEGHSVNISDLGSMVEPIMYSNEDSHREELCHTVSPQNNCDSDYETHSETSGQSERVASSDVDYNHREYDVEEYVEQINNCTDESEASSNVPMNNEILKSDSKELPCTAKVKSLDSESFERQKHLEHIFNLTVKEQDNEFIGELKTLLLSKVNSYFLQKNDKNKCSLSDDIRRVAIILNRAIADKDSVICDKVHELCLRLRDILVLKDEILNDPMTESVKQEINHGQSFNIETNVPSVLRPIPEPTNIRPMGKGFTNYTEEDFTKEHVSNEKITMIHSYTTNNESTVKLASSNSTQKESFESLIKFSRIPVPKSKLPKLGTNQSKSNQKSSTPQSKVPSSSIKHYGINSKDSLNRKDSFSHSDKRVNTKTTRDVLQHKEEILRKAMILGLIDNAHEIPKDPYLTERAQLALLEKKIQGKLKSKQLALERRKYGLRDRLSNIKLSNTDTSKIQVSEVNTQTQQVEEQPINRTPNNSSGQLSYTLIHDNKSKESITVNNSSPNNNLNKEIKKSQNLESRENTDTEKFVPMNGTTVGNADNLNYENEDRNNEIVRRESYTNCFNAHQIPLLSSLASAAMNKKKLDNFQSRNRNQSIHPRARAKPSIISVILPLLVVIAGVVFFVYQKQFFDSYNQWSFIMHQVWERVKMYDLKGKFEEQFGEVRKYVKAKCESL